MTPPGNFKRAYFRTLILLDACTLGVLFVATRFLA